MGRTPHGVRGLKLPCAVLVGLEELSHPAWGAWIEILTESSGLKAHGSHPAWGAWIEILTPSSCLPDQLSHPAWGAWIEISVVQMVNYANDVAPRMGCVD